MGSVCFFVSEKAETFLEVLGNSELRSETGDALRETAARLVDYVTVGQEAEPHPCLDTSLLKVGAAPWPWPRSKQTGVCPTYILDESDDNENS